MKFPAPSSVNSIERQGNLGRGRRASKKPTWSCSPFRCPPTETTERRKEERQKSGGTEGLERTLKLEQTSSVLKSLHYRSERNKQIDFALWQLWFATGSLVPHGCLSGSCRNDSLNTACLDINTSYKTEMTPSHPLH